MNALAAPPLPARPYRNPKEHIACVDRELPCRPNSLEGAYLDELLPSKGASCPLCRLEDRLEDLQDGQVSSVEDVAVRTEMCLGDTSSLIVCSGMVVGAA